MDTNRMTHVCWCGHFHTHERPPRTGSKGTARRAAEDAAVWLLSHKPQPVEDLRSELRSRGVPPTTATRALNNISEPCYISGERHRRLNPEGMRRARLGMMSP